MTSKIEFQPNDRVIIYPYKRKGTVIGVQQNSNFVRVRVLNSYNKTYDTNIHKSNMEKDTEHG